MSGPLMVYTITYSEQTFIVVAENEKAAHMEAERLRLTRLPMTTTKSRVVDGESR
jgi:hypothetical protein